MDEAYAVDLWVLPNGTLGCRKTYRGRDGLWHYVDVSELDSNVLSRELEKLRTAVEPE